MKKIGFIAVPLLFIVFASAMMPRLLAGGVHPTVLIAGGVAVILAVGLIRPKKGPTKSLQQLLQEIMDDYCKDAFADSPELQKQFHSALTDASKSMPKSAAAKLQKLAPSCVTDQQKYAVAMASACVYKMSQDWKNVIREYNKAIVLNPTDTLAYNIGECNQRLGNLDKARDSYEFAMELNPESPKYPSSLGTVCVGDGDYDTAMDYAQDALDIQKDYPQALATMAICYGMKNDALMHNHYLKLAMENGYSQEKIESTVKALKKRER